MYNVLRNANSEGETAPQNFRKELAEILIHRVG